MPALTPTGDLDAFGALIRNARVRQGLSQDALAKLVGIPQSVVSAVERGSRVHLDAALVLRLSECLTLDAGDTLRAAAARTLDVDGRVVDAREPDDGGALLDDVSPVDLTPKPEPRSPSLG